MTRQHEIDALFEGDAAYEFEDEANFEDEAVFEDEAYESDFEAEFESRDDDPDDDISGEWEDSEWASFNNEANAILSESEISDLAYELLEITDEAELEEFLGKIFRKVKRGVRKIGRRIGKGVGRFIRGSGGKLLRGALPLVGSAVGSIIPGAGTMIGGAAGSALAGLLGGKGAKGGAGGALAGLLGAGNPLAALLGSGALGNLLGPLLGREMESATLPEAKHDLAKRVIRTIAESADSESLEEARSKFKHGYMNNVPVGVREAMKTPAAAVGGGAAGSGTWTRRGGNIVLTGV